MLGYSLRDVITIEANMSERYILLNLKFLTYQLFIDDEHKLQELIAKLQSFQKKINDKKQSDVDMPKFYKDASESKP